MKKALVLFASIWLVSSVHAASSLFGNNFLYWTLDDVGSSLQFMYAVLVAHGAEDPDPIYLPIGNSAPVAGEYADTFEAPDGIPVTSLPANYAQLPVDYQDMSCVVQIYDGEGILIGSSDSVAFVGLGDYVYGDMGTAGIDGPYHFTITPPGPIPEPTGALLLALGMGVLALRRRRDSWCADA